MLNYRCVHARRTASLVATLGALQDCTDAQRMGKLSADSSTGEWHLTESHEAVPKSRLEAEADAWPATNTERLRIHLTVSRLTVLVTWSLAATSRKHG